MNLLLNLLKGLIPLPGLLDQVGKLSALIVGLFKKKELTKELDDAVAKAKNDKDTSKLDKLF